MGRAFDRIFRRNRKASNGALEKNAAELKATEERLELEKREAHKAERDRETAAAQRRVSQEHKERRPGGKPVEVQGAEAGSREGKADRTGEWLVNRMSSRTKDDVVGGIKNAKKVEKVLGVKMSPYKDDEEPEL